MRWSSDRMVIDGDLSVDAVSPTFEYATQHAAKVQLKWSGTPEGSFFLQSSLNGEDFIDIPGTERAVPSSEGPGNHIWVLDEAGDFKLRVKWIAQAGSVGLVQIWQGGKGG